VRDPCSRNRIALLAVVAIMLHVFAAVSGRGYEEGTAEAAPAALSVDESTTRAVQLVLKSYGYTIAVDGVYGPQTTRVVKSWQKSNGLAADGIAGPVTQASLGLSPAVRGTQVQVTPTVPPPPRSVEQMIRDIWPDDSEEWALRIAWRESNYRPGVTSPTGCCHGVFQIHEIHFSWMRALGVTTVSQLFDAETNIRMALELYRRNGTAPWNL
jgi:peptidoglycan hydrolase-like protein with peptidoglycan-binding domain